jgi:hypothetical protein
VSHCQFRESTMATLLLQFYCNRLGIGGNLLLANSEWSKNIRNRFIPAHFMTWHDMTWWWWWWWSAVCLSSNIQKLC